MQWKQMDFPIMVDTLNRIGVSAVPLLWAIDEHGVVRGVRQPVEWFENDFLNTEYEAPATEPELIEPEPAVDAFLDGDWDGAVEGFREAVESNRRDGAAWFRLGCALRARFDWGEEREPGDLQASVEAWTKAIDLEPRNYIFRRRIQQYGPRMDKPYPFYDWVAAAREQVSARGDTPVALTCEPAGAELAQGARSFDVIEGAGPEEPDPDEELELDEELVTVEAAVIPAPIEAGKSARVAVTLIPNPEYEVHWTNDAGPCHLVIDAPDGWRVSSKVLVSDVPTDTDASCERRLLDFELLPPKGAAGNEVDLDLYVTYFVCEGEEGECLYLRQNVTLPVQVSASRSRR